jgi:hypothetical protein
MQLASPDAHFWVLGLLRAGQGVQRLQSFVSESAKVAVVAVVVVVVVVAAVVVAVVEFPDVVASGTNSGGASCGCPAMPSVREAYICIGCQMDGAVELMGAQVLDRVQS